MRSNGQVPTEGSSSKLPGRKARKGPGTLSLERLPFCLRISLFGGGGVDIFVGGTGPQNILRKSTKSAIDLLAARISTYNFLSEL